jgi:hypothetical protein
MTAVRQVPEEELAQVRVPARRLTKRSISLGVLSTALFVGFIAGTSVAASFPYGFACFLLSVGALVFALAMLGKSEREARPLRAILRRPEREGYQWVEPSDAPLLAAGGGWLDDEVFLERQEARDLLTMRSLLREHWCARLDLKGQAPPAEIEVHPDQANVVWIGGVSKVLERAFEARVIAYVPLIAKPTGEWPSRVCLLGREVGAAKRQLAEAEILELRHGTRQAQGCATGCLLAVLGESAFLLMSALGSTGIGRVLWLLAGVLVLALGGFGFCGMAKIAHQRSSEQRSSFVWVCRYGDVIGGPSEFADILVEVLPESERLWRIGDEPSTLRR